MFGCVTTVDDKDVVVNLISARALFGPRWWWAIATPISVSVPIPIAIPIWWRWWVIGEENDVVLNLTIGELAAPVPAAHVGKQGLINHLSGQG
jgi:hypothetical protein